jgi:hypothetical protein
MIKFNIANGLNEFEQRFAKDKKGIHKFLIRNYEKEKIIWLEIMWININFIISNISLDFL